MVHPDRAVEIVIGQAGLNRGPGRRESVGLAEALGRVLTQAIASPVDHPPFDKSAMDGYAYSELLPDQRYRVVGSAAAGSAKAEALARGEVLKIMTGAPIPAGVRGVQRVEWTRQDGEAVVFTRPELYSNIIARGENLAAGSELLGPRVLAAQDIGILASAGFAELEVAARPRVGVVSTGDEIAPQGRPLPGAAIYDSNGPQLVAQAREAGAEARFYGLVPDRRDALRELLSAGLEGSDVLLVSGGVSMGDFDLVPSTLEALGVEALYHGLLMKPGKPSFFGRRGRTVVFGLPGNPVSTFVGFEVFVKAYLRALMGLDPRPSFLPAVLARKIVRRETDRVEYLPVRLESGGRGLLAHPLSYKGSSMITVLAEAEALIRLEIGQSSLGEGALVHARRVRA